MFVDNEHHNVYIPVLQSVFMVNFPTIISHSAEDIGYHLYSSLGQWGNEFELVSLDCVTGGVNASVR